MTVNCHSKMFESSTKPAEKPSTGFLVSSAVQRQMKLQSPRRKFHRVHAWRVHTSQLLLQEVCSIIPHSCLLSLLCPAFTVAAPVLLRWTH